MVHWPISLPRSIAWTRAAFAMFSSTISVTPAAGQMPSSLSGAPIAACSACSGARLIEHDLAAGEEGGVDLAEDDIGVGHRGLAAAAAIADRSRRRAGTVGADGDAAELVDARDRAAAGADLHHLDDGDAHRQARAFHVAIGARDLEFARPFRFAVAQQAYLGRGAAHVEGQHFVEPALPRDGAGKDGAARRPGFDQADREARGGFERGKAATRHHQEERRLETAVAKAHRAGG